MASGKFVAYLRVSTERQGKSGLGIEAQRRAIADYLSTSGGQLIAPEYKEHESGRMNDRPQLAKAMARCRATGATLIVAKLDRLSRNVAFLSALMDSKIDFVCADNPHATRFTIHILAAVAEHEREMISKRTREALASAKARGKRLGGRRKNAPDIRQYQSQGVNAAAERINEWLEDLAGDLRALKSEGLSLNATARKLNASEIRSTRGGAWTATAVSRALARV